ncbi:hypothetical protein BPOR_0977g00020 [Botrytis porri]|uniref:Uncharacterized protein n=1 Tax=Botrytis porri TaxID=87229 RepID=A0A4Z1K707_9HELO|nr:hypothetical protein BPOR_0977g00020 [Botrytis porri]
MEPQPKNLASQKPQTASNKSESKSKYAFTQNTVLSALDRTLLEKGLRKQWKFFSEDDKMFGSLDVRGGYIAHDMCTWRKDISSSSPKDILNLKQCLAGKALRFWEKNPDPEWIPGAKEEQAFVEAYDNMVKIIQGIPAEKADNYSAYMEHRLRLATSTDGGEILGPLLHEVLSNKVSNPEMRFAAYQAAKALHPENNVNIDPKDDINVDYSQSEKRKNSKKVTTKSLDGRNFALLVNNSSGKRKRLSGDEDNDDVETAKNRNDGNVVNATAGISTVHSKPLEDETFKSQSIPKEEIAGVGTKTNIPFSLRGPAYTSVLGTETFGTGLRTSRLRTFDTGGSSTTRKSNTQKSNNAILDNSPKFELSDLTTPLSLLSKPNKRRKVTDEDKVEGQDDKFKLDTSGPDWVRK